jgi:phosphohistidine phosphatase
MAKRLVLVRHAKSSWADSDLADHERPLKGRGRRAAGLVGRYLRDAALLPDLVLCSSATRARDTLTLLELPAATDVHIEDELYDASADDLLARLRLVPPAVGSVLLIGHNPAVEILTWMLVDPADRLPDRFPTAAVAEIRLPAASWREVELHGGRLGSFVVPRDLEGTP